MRLKQNFSRVRVLAVRPLTCLVLNPQFDRIDPDGSVWA
jgi:hypothetical protein